MNTTKNPYTKPQKTKRLSNIRIFFGSVMFIISLILCISFISYLSNWQADQSQAGMLMDKSVKSSNLFGKIGDWIGNIFIFESIGVAAFIIAFLFTVFGLLILKKKYFRPWKSLGHSIFFICWIPIFMGAITKGEGVLSGVYGFQIMDFLSSVIGSFGLWLIIISSIVLYFILEFNLRPDAIKERFQTTSDKIKSLIPTSEESNIEEKEENIETELDTPSSIKETTESFVKDEKTSSKTPI